ncbi:MAG: tetratricopeptide repeat protein, partial [Chitinophagaceae bacterium]
KLGDAYGSLGELDKSIIHYEEYYSIMEKISEKNPEMLYFKLNSIAVLQSLGVVCQKGNDHLKALNYFERSHTQTIDLINKYPKVSEIKRGLGVIYQHKAHSYHQLNNDYQAHANYVAMHDCFYELTITYPDNPLYRHNLAYACCRLGLFFIGNNNEKDAMAHFINAQNLWAKLVLDYPEIIEYKEKLSLVQELGNIENWKE